MKKQAFSLIELLISLIIISMITAAFSPVITKKFKKNILVRGAQDTVTNKCSEKFSSDCELCNSKICLICRKTCSGSTFLDSDSCSCKSCISNCAACSNDTECNRCNPGYKLNGTQCQICPNYTFSDDGLSCKSCPTGTFGAGEGAASCKICEKGHYCLGGNKDMQKCPTGTYNPYTGKSACIDCPAGKRTSNPGAASSSQCVTCGAGLWCAGGASWGVCPNHSTTPNGGGATKCDCYEGYYYLQGAGICDDCPVNYYCTQYSNVKIKCPDGEYAPRNSASCKKYSDVAGGNYILSNGTQATCPSGYYCTNGIKTPCPSGSATGYTGQSSCLNCNTNLHLGERCYACHYNNCTGCNGSLVNVRGQMRCQ